MTFRSKVVHADLKMGVTSGTDTSIQRRNSHCWDKNLSFHCSSCYCYWISKSINLYILGIYFRRVANNLYMCCTVLKIFLEQWKFYATVTWMLCRYFWRRGKQSPAEVYPMRTTPWRHALCSGRLQFFILRWRDFFSYYLPVNWNR
jgi:hypothetical protein